MNNGPRVLIPLVALGLHWRKKPDLDLVCGIEQCVKKIMEAFDRRRRLMFRGIGGRMTHSYFPHARPAL